MTTFLFWNLNQKPLQKIVSNLVFQHEVDVLMLTECTFLPETLLKLLNQNGTSLYHYSPCIGCRKVHIFSKFTNEFIKPIEESERLTIRHLNLPGTSDILLAVIHFPSKLHWNDSSQAYGML